ncbi:phytoene/squalene synthase family protein [Alkalicoccobacillus porphyridii]|uniref:Phytoene/squalene synthase family protein n=1 Tax=Alkalicoccobacillus porphyridii TaxID=2597270 RepID=A0A553ZYR8_9BACI|nr:phytoene/squalene synthase family protein [Alkalicoccobacillus porphyridii]TSB46591.1 phytoene/squalene synthase family protein [Alkalicoccobacillus porphyridii]
MKTLEEAYQDCHTIINRHSKTFSKAFSLLPSPKRKAVWAIYSFCRSVDDIVDEGDDPENEIIAFEKEFLLFLENHPNLEKSIWIALHDVFQRFSMNQDAFLDMIKGQKMDLVKNRYQTMAEVEEYSYYVAGTVGLMLLPVLAPDNHLRLTEGGKALGTAMQITNILRDVGEDIERNRIYLPMDLMDKYQVTEEQIREGKVTKSFILLWEEMASRAEELYQIAFQSIDHYPLDARLPVKGAAYMYRAILNSVRENQYNVFTQRSYVTKEEKQKILAQL